MSDMFRDNKGRRTSILGIPAMQEEAIFTHVLAKNRSNVDRKFADLVRLVKEKDPERRFINGKLYDIQSLNSMADLYGQLAYMCFSWTHMGHRKNWAILTFFGSGNCFFEKRIVSR